MKIIHLFLPACLFMITRTDAQCEIRHQSDAGGSFSDIIQNICLSADGGFLAAGFSDSHASKYKSQGSRGGVDYWVVKYDSSGSILWDKTIGGNKDDFLFTAVSTSDGGYILGGGSASGISGEKTNANLG